MNMHFMELMSYSPKNKAHEELQSFFRAFNDCLIDDENLEDFKRSAQHMTELVNQNHPRCQDINLQIDSFTDNSQSISVEGNFQLRITKVKRVELTEPMTDDVSVNAIKEKHHCPCCGKRSCTGECD